MNQRSLVLVEDDLGDAFLVREMLADVAPGVRLASFTTLRAALEDWPADAECALIDLGLPDAFGLTALEELRQQVPDVPVVVLTGRSDDGLGPAALAAGAQDFLVKGQVDGPGLERSLRYAIERGRASTYQRDLMAAELHAQENARLQRGLLPTPLMASPDLRLGQFYRPGSQRVLLGGDFYDVVETGSEINVLIGDVSGHGPDEAALGVALRIAWRTLVLAGLPVGDVIRGVEQVLLAERSDDERFATLAMVTVAAGARRLEVVSCGHPAPILLRATAAVELQLQPLPMLTMLDGGPIEPVSVDVDGDWGLLLYTDGLIEGRPARDRASFGAASLTDALGRLLASGAARGDLPPAVLAEAERCNGGLLTDDVAMLLVGTASWWG